jgi:hypothetical protein
VILSSDAPNVHTKGGRATYRDMQTAFANICAARNVCCHGLKPQPHDGSRRKRGWCPHCRVPGKRGKTTSQQCRKRKVYVHHSTDCWAKHVPAVSEKPGNTD